jgi:hypothetical protein
MNFKRTGNGTWETGGCGCSSSTAKKKYVPSNDETEFKFFGMRSEVVIGDSGARYTTKVGQLAIDVLKADAERFAANNAGMFATSDHKYLSGYLARKDPNSLPNA